MSPRAAWRLEALRFTRVYDYVAGKADWGSFGLPLEGRYPSATRVAARAREDAPACRLEERLPDVRRRVAASGFGICLVVNDQRVVLGLLGRRALETDDLISVEEAMTPGPSTVRPSVRLDEALERMRLRNLSVLPVTRSDGVLVGVLLRADAERAQPR